MYIYVYICIYIHTCIYTKNMYLGVLSLEGAAVRLDRAERLQHPTPQPLTDELNAKHCAQLPTPYTLHLPWHFRP